MIDANKTPIGIWSDEMPPINLHNYPMKNTEARNQFAPFDVQRQIGALGGEAMTGQPTGSKFDGSKPRMDLLDSDWLEGVAQVLTFGANKYAAHNWRGGIAYSRLIAAAYRHLGAINRGDDIDPESGLPHADHLSCCIMFLSSMMKNKPELDDRYKEVLQERERSE